MNDSSRKELERNSTSWHMLETEHRILDWRLENLQADNGLGEVHTMHTLRDFLSRRGDPLEPRKGRHRI